MQRVEWPYAIPNGKEMVTQLLCQYTPFFHRCHSVVEDYNWEHHRPIVEAPHGPGQGSPDRVDFLGFRRGIRIEPPHPQSPNSTLLFYEATLAQHLDSYLGYNVLQFLDGLWRQFLSLQNVILVLFFKNPSSNLIWHVPSSQHKGIVRIA